MNKPTLIEALTSLSGASEWPLKEAIEILKDQNALTVDKTRKARHTLAGRDAPVDPDTTYLSAAQVADELDVTTATVMYHRRRGAFPRSVRSTSSGAPWMFHPEDVAQFKQLQRLG